MINYMPSFYLMGRNNKPITKGCPYCELQTKARKRRLLNSLSTLTPNNPDDVAVACKTCPGCKHSFHNAKRLLSQSVHYADSLTLSSRRRTERVKREKPNYYDSSEFERKASKKRLERSRLSCRVSDNAERCRPSLQTLKKKKKKKLNKPIKEEEEETAIVLPSDKLKQCSIILAELNRKMSTTTWRR